MSLQSSNFCHIKTYSFIIIIIIVGQTVVSKKLQRLQNISNKLINIFLLWNIQKQPYL